MNYEKQELYTIESMLEYNPSKALSLIEERLNMDLDSFSRNKLMLYKAFAYKNKGNKESAEALVRVLLNIAINDQDKHLESSCFMLMSKLHNNNLQDAIRLSEQSLEIAVFTNDKSLIAEAYHSLGECFFNLRDIRKAITNWKIAVRLSSQGSHHYLTEKILQHMAEGYKMLRMHKKSEEVLLAALEINSLTRNDDYKIAELTNIAVLKMLNGQFLTSEKTLNQAILVAESSNNPIMLGSVLANMAALMVEMKNYEKCIEYSQRLLEVLPKDNDPMNKHMRVNSELNIVQAYIGSGDTAKAWKALELANDSLLSYSTPELILFSKQCMLELLWVEGRYQEAEIVEKDAIKTCRKYNMTDEMKMIYETMASNYEKLGKTTRCIKIYKNIVKVQSKQITQLHDSLKVEGISITISAPDSHEMKDNSQLVNLEAAHFRVTDTFIGQSPAACSIRDKIKAIAKSPNIAVLISGESGTGKEIVAHLIHKLSTRSKYPMLAVNAAAIPASLMESELFGYKRGAFTNAYSDTQGIFIRAQHGTVYLDEISEMPYDLQVKLLRVLESRKVVPLGGSKEIPFDCRIVSSTNRNLQSLVNTQSFRLDLYHRLNSMEIYIPPLRDRQEDIPLLLSYYSGRLATNLLVTRPIICDSFIKALTSYYFPGNVRELINIVEKMMVLYPGERWTSSLLEKEKILKLSCENPLDILKNKHRRDEIHEIIEALQKAGGKQNIAARILKISESTLCRRIAQYALQGHTAKGGKSVT